MINRGLENTSLYAGLEKSQSSRLEGKRERERVPKPWT
jgi:hypothetical protein